MEETRQNTVQRREQNLWVEQERTRTALLEELALIQAGDQHLSLSTQRVEVDRIGQAP